MDAATGAKMGLADKVIESSKKRSEELLNEVGLQSSPQPSSYSPAVGPRANKVFDQRLGPECGRAEEGSGPAKAR